MGRKARDLGKSRESVAELEWDDAGIQLQDEGALPDQFWTIQGHAFEHSILRYIRLKGIIRSINDDSLIQTEHCSTNYHTFL